MIEVKCLGFTLVEWLPVSAALKKRGLSTPAELVQRLEKLERTLRVVGPLEIDPDTTEDVSSVSERSPDREEC